MITAPRIIKPLLILCAIALSFKAFREPDFWWMLRTGEWMLENGAVISQDVFSYTMAGNEWLNVKWLYEVWIAILAGLGGPESIPVLAGLFYAGTLALLWKTSNLSKSHSAWAIGTAALLFLLGSEFRMTGRPEMSSHLLTATFLFLLARHGKQKDRLIFLLIPLQALWTNLHEGYGTGMVIILGWSLMEVVRQFWGHPANLKQTGLLLLGVLLAPACAPHGFSMIWHPVEIFTQLGRNQFTTELHAATTAYYWAQKEAWMVAGVALLLLGMIGQNLSRGIRTFMQSERAPTLGFAALFTGLAFTAHRNIPFALIATFPLIVAMAEWILQKTPTLVQKGMNWSIVGFCALFYIAIVSNTYYDLSGSRDRFGLYIMPDKHPIAAGEALKSLPEKDRIFSDYLTSAYLLHTLQPEFKTFIDLRDLDVFDGEFFQEYGNIVAFPEAFEAADSTYQFSAASIYQPSMNTLHTHLYNHPDWHILAADPVSVTYSHSSGEDANFSGFAPATQGRFASAITHLLNPLFEFPAIEKEASMIAANYYLRVDDRQKALTIALNALKKNAQNKEALLIYGSIYADAVSTATSQENRENFYAQAERSLLSVIRTETSNIRARAALAGMYLDVGQDQKAYEITKRGLEIQPMDSAMLQVQAAALSYLTQKASGRQGEYFAAYIETLKQALALNPSHKPFRFKLSIMLCERNRCDEAAPYLKDLEIPNLPESEKNRLESCRRKCL